MEKTDEFKRILKEGEGKSMAFRGLLMKRVDVAEGKDTTGTGNRDEETKGGNEVHIVERVEKKRLHWKGLTCEWSASLPCSLITSLDLAPLTTVGNLVRYFVESYWR